MGGAEIIGAPPSDRAPSGAQAPPRNVSGSDASTGTYRHALRPLPLWASGVAGAVGAFLVLLGGAQQGSPFTVKAAGAWFFGNGAKASAGGATSGRFLGIVLVYLGIALMLAAWFEVVRSVRAHSGTPIRPLVIVLIAWEIPVLLMAPMFSRDVYSYAAQGQLVTRGINPYLHGPSALGGGPFLSLVDPIWRRSPAPYGPTWERLSEGIVSLSGHDVLGSVLGFRLIALLGVTVLAWAVPALARSIGRDPSVAFALALLNPLVLLDLLGAAHNDALMLGLLVAACALARKHHILMGLTLCAMAAQVKIPALIGAVYIGWWWAGAEASWRPRLVKVASALVLTAALMAAISAISALGWGWVHGLSNAGSVVSWLDPATAVGLATAHLASALGYTGHSIAFVHSARLVALAIAGLVSVFLLLRSRRLGDIDAFGWSLLAFAVLGPVVWPWYETWGFVFLAVVAERWTLRLLLFLCAVACFADVPRPGLLVAVNPILAAACWICLAAMVGLFVITRVAPFMSPGSAQKGRFSEGAPTPRGLSALRLK